MSSEELDPVVARLTEAADNRGTAPAFAWTTLSNIAQQVIRFVSSVVLARILIPADYGLVAVVGSVTLFASLFTDLGLGSAIIHERTPSRTFLSTAFWINTISGFVLALLSGGAGYLMALIYHEPALRHLMWIAGLTFALDICVVHTSIMERALHFRQLALIETATLLFGIGVSIATAACGFGASSLVLGPVAATVATSIWMWLAVPWRPAWIVSRSAAATTLRFGRGLVGANALSYWSRNADNILLARFASASELGLYSRAYSLMMAPILQITSVFGRVLFPTLARMRDDKQALGRYWLRATKVGLLTTLPAALTCATAGPALIDGLYGPRWRGAGVILELLGIAAAIQILPASTGQVFQATGATGKLFRVGVRMSICTVLAIVIGLPWGAIGVATGIAANSWLTFWYPVRGACRLTDISLREVIGSMVGLFLSGVAFSVASLAVRLPLHADLTSIELVLAQAAAGTAAMFAALAIFDRPLFLVASGYAGRAARRIVPARLGQSSKPSPPAPPTPDTQPSAELEPLLDLIPPAHQIPGGVLPPAPVLVPEPVPAPTPEAPPLPAPTSSSTQPLTRLRHPTENPYNWLAKHQLERAISTAAANYARGRLIDIGCGEKPYRTQFAAFIDEHVGVDHPDSPHALNHVDVLAVADSIPLPDAEFDTALLSEVLEHLEDPLASLREAHRLLRPGGHLILTTPFIWVLHEEPRDFYRYSPFGLRWLLEQAGFEVVQVTPLGGQWSTLALLLSYSLRESRVPSRIAAALSGSMQQLALRLEGRKVRAWMAYNHLAIARKRD